MKKLLAIAAALAALSPAAEARPYPDRLGICYQFKNGEFASRAPCVISTGYGAGAQYMTLTFNGKEYYAEYPNIRPNMPPTLDDKPALEYRRDTSFLDILKGKALEGEEYMSCIKTKDGKLDLCYAYGS